jgi:hypothetical protein
MILYISIAFTLIAMVAGLYLLAKAKAEGLGKLFSITAYAVIIIAGLSLLCQLGRSAMHMACRSGICPPSENCMPGMMHKEIIMRGPHGECGMHAGCRDEEECCESRSCSDEMGEGGGMHHGCAEMRGHGDCCKHGEGKGGCMKNGEQEEGMKKDSSGHK